MRTAVGVAALWLIATSCKREERPFDDSPLALSLARASELQPGPMVISDTARGTLAPTTAKGRYDDNAWGANEGKRLFSQMNCTGCHSNGGGGIGPALMDDEWIYGADASTVYETIVSGRANGMPSYKDKLTPQQVWQLVSFVRSLSGLTPKGARPARSDHMQVKPAEMQTPNAKPRVAPPRTAPPKP
jgi:cytochrome c oxidase cbb3-type subunit III